jgi:serine/threonine-protein kinase
LILFEHFDGTSLKVLLEKDALSSEQKKHIFVQMLKGVSAAHHRNIIHRDLKPGNVLVDADGNTKLTDFGISKFKSTAITRSGELIGTILYTAPELNNEGSGGADARSDIYALGHIFYEIAMGAHFWKRKGWTELEDFMRYLDQTPAPTEAIELSDFRCDFFTNTRAALARMVKIKPEERYETVDDILLALGETPDEVPPVVIEPEEPLSSILPNTSDFDLRSPLLIVESGANRLARTVLGLRDGQTRSIGRSDLAGSDDSISRQHLEFSRQGDHYYVRDLNSKNGTMVHGLALKRGGSPVEIRHADHIKVGDIFLRFAFMKKV